MKTIFEMINEPYVRKARVIPGLLVALPVLVPLLCVYGSKQPILTSLIGLLSGCGAIYALANVARGRGKRLEETLINKWGGMPTTIALRHRDNFFDNVSKLRYHAAITTKLGIPMPTVEEEEENPEKADDIYIGAVRRLRELTRSNKGLLLRENTTYGFHRNMLAMKPVGIFSCIVGIIYGLIISKIIQVVPPHLYPINFAKPGLSAGLTLLISISILSSWFLYFNESSVKRIGFVYAERLFECLPSLRSTAIRKKKL
ncbi:hypothetical protein JK217_11025 [Gluconobacter kondonii]|uniref:hypothetical protein n=1 Tax=Gluconobacter kondonii TaxID=941463 RepID=UPI001B8B6969|nr:hypothetical protein [Gluconobacter kondonii]MBS1078273.1 hypothetical protein [Gluconobacter kondonii]